MIFGNAGLLQFYAALWIHVIDANCRTFITKLHIFDATQEDLSIQLKQTATRYPEKHLNTEKNAVVLDPCFLIRHTPGITKIPI